ncbi:NAD(P)-dependent alcohol dehydrogenase [Nonlabens marinus]|uniref:Alcohol dehydrogenase n=1 Tax=Nonlabens marinus S1-08 TaxID=1454201 RepID=W8VS30_9FLAO|nr:NAD(P)-dependent alcohol dehydrogenase [Nonlabens marinus]BAO55975.1 alcohol dehydrogenase [Nonlabens marinus S1-08]
MKADIHYKESTFTVKGYGAKDENNTTLKEMDVERPMIKEDEVIIETLYSGVCHSDIHQVHNDWENTRYPCVPGHEVIGKIVNAGSKVTKFKEGDIVGVGCMIDSCQACPQCKNDQEQFCTGPHGPTMTYNGYFADPESDFNTYGGYASHLVSNQDFLIKIPDTLDIKAAAPILCAGVTTYSPLKHWGVKKGDQVAVVGIGGLGHMGVQLAKAMGAKVTAITTEKSKTDDVKALGADHVLLSTDDKAMEEHAMKFDFILITIPSAFDVNPYISLIAPRGSLVTVGLLGAYESPTNNMEVAKYARSIGGSIIGGIKETQDVMNFCAKHGILPEVEMIGIEQINDAFQKVKEEDVRFRYVIDMKS